MTPKQYTQLRNLFAQVVEAPIEQRSTLQNSLGQNHPELCNDLNALLSLVDNTNELLKTTKGADQSQPRNHTAVVDARETLGRYRIVKEIGRGGTSIVFEAEQDNPKRRVALKILDSGFASHDQHRRFEHESRILGMLRHPGIAHVYDAKTANLESGTRPYFAMELVEGKSLLQFAREQRLSLTRRIALFVQVCEAVHYAHQKGVIHRDLKPDNILVDCDGRVKVLDFGVARLTKSNSQTLTCQTSVGQLVGTIQYMSPEQASGHSELVDIRTDVYALGVILYELLSDRLPYDLGGNPIHEVVRIIRENDAIRLGSIKPSLRGDLETIVHVALTKELKNRYQSVVELIGDLRRHINHEPITARPRSSFYVLRKLARRHRVPFALSCALFISLSVFSIYMIALYSRARNAESLALHRLRALDSAQQAILEEARNAEEQSQNAWNIAHLLQEVTSIQDFGAVEQNQGHSTTKQRLLDIGERAEALLREHPEHEANIRTALGRTCSRIGFPVLAIEHFMAASAIRKTLFGENDQSVAQSHLDLALLFRTVNDYNSAAVFYREAVEILRSPTPKHDSLYLHALGGLITALSWSRPQEAMEAINEKLDLLRATFPEDDLRIVQTKIQLVTLLRIQGRLAEAGELVDELLPISDQRVRAHPLLAHAALTKAAWALRDAGRLSEANRLADQGIRIIDSPGYLTAQQKIHGSLLKTALLMDAGRYDAAKVEAERGIELNNATTLSNSSLAKALGNLAGVAWAKGEYELAESKMRQSLAIAQASDLPSASTIAMRTNSLAVVLRDGGQFEEAEELFLEADQSLSKQNTHDRRLLAIVPNNLARLYLLSGELVLAENQILRALDLRKQSLPNDHMDVVESQMVYGMILTKADKDLLTAETLLRDALLARRSVYGDQHVLVAENENALGYCVMKLGRFRESEQLLIASQQVLQRELTEQHKLNRLAKSRMKELRKRSSRRNHSAETMLPISPIRTTK